MAKKIRTVCGDISPRSVNLPLPHEHLLFRAERPHRVAAAYYRQAMPLLEQDLAALRGTGCNLLVDVTPEGCGRHPAFQREVAQRTGLHLVACTGAYVRRGIPPAAHRRTVAQMAELMVAEIEQGMAGTDIRAGIIKLGSATREPRPVELRFLRAAVIAHQATGAPIHCHSYPAVKHQAEFFRHAGVAPDRVALAHIEVTAWLEMIEAAKAGYMLCYTNFGGERIIPEDVSVAQVATLVRLGYTQQLLLSVDFLYSPRGGALVPSFPVRYNHLHRVTVPKLQRAGVSEAQLHTILTLNARRYLAF